MRFRVHVRDVNGQTPAGPRVVAYYDKEGHDGQTNRISHLLSAGQEWDLPLARPTVQFAASADEFAFELITVAEKAGRWLADSPAAVVTWRQDLVTIDVTVGCIRLAPTVTLPPDKLVKENPGAALVDPSDGGMYRAAWLNRETIHRLDEPIFGDLSKPGWARFRHTPVNVPLKERGAYMLLEYGYDNTWARPRSGPRFLVAVWAPRVALGPRPQVVVFYSPPTKPGDFPVDSYPFLRSYPYAAYATAPPQPRPAGEVFPPYTHLAVRYLVSGYKILYQILAAGRNPVVVMPIQPSQNWGPLACQAGLCRLIKEVLRFLYARQLASGRAAPIAKLSLAGGRASVFPDAGLFTDERIPDAWMLTVSGFSAGINPVLSVCTKESFDDKLYVPELFHAPPAPLRDGWREIWDIDGVADSAESHLKTLRSWLSTTTNRRVRSYHSTPQGSRTAPRALVEAPRIVRQSGTATQGVYAEEGTSADGRATWVLFSKNSLGQDPKEKDPPRTIPQLGKDDAHHTVIELAFGHAAQFRMP
jgi:hypothetical protein